jgi:hypothetical protein
MASLDRNLRRDLESAVKKARRVAEAGARQAVEQLAVGHHEPWSALLSDQRKLRNRLRAHGRQLGDKLDEKKGTQSIDRLAVECAYEHWHRLLFARFLAENDLLVEPESGVALSLDECRELAREQSKDWLVLASDFAQRMLPQIFRAGDPVLEVALPPEKRQELEAILEGLPREVFIADDSLGWVYQFWQAEQKDTVNASENKIGAEELPAVTQIFTEDYMVLFLLHNTLGAWWAGKVLAAKPDLARAAASEEECRTACAMQGVEWNYLRFVREGEVWRPAAGTFLGWPTVAKALTVLDPCMGSGHFLAFVLPMLVALRREEEKLSVEEAVDAVLRDNLFGLELDPRCTQIAAFNVGLTAWKLAGYRPLPSLNLACAGLGINAPVSSWTALAAGDALAENAMKQLYELFRQAPTLGSLINPTRVGNELFVANFDQISGLLSSALASEQTNSSELAVVARGLAVAASILAKKFTIVSTNVPYLSRAKQNEELREFCDQNHATAKGDLATCMLDRALEICSHGGVVAVVVPQNWLFLEKYRSFRRSIVKSHTFSAVVRLGAKAFQTPMWDFNVALVSVCRDLPDDESEFVALDLSDLLTPHEKSIAISRKSLTMISQASVARREDYAVTFETSSIKNILRSFASSLQGTTTGDNPRFILQHWEIPFRSGGVWEPFQGTVGETTDFAGCESIIRWEQGRGALAQSPEARVQGMPAFGREGVLVCQMGDLFSTRYLGHFFSMNTAVILPQKESDLAPLWSFVADPNFAAEVRKIDQALKVTNATFLKVPFDERKWREVAAVSHPSGLPRPATADPTQWIFGGHPVGSNAPLQVAVARLVRYEWPRQVGASFVDCPANGPDGLELHADDDGIVCLPSLRGEAPAAERVRALLADAFGAEWTAHKLNELLASVDFAGASLDDWLRDGFFVQHCALFEQLPFVWQIWDGRNDGFSALVNYHQLAAPNGEGRRILDKLTHTYLGDWLDRQRADQKAGVEGADGRVAAADHLKRELEKILVGEPPYDIFVRWKPLHQQPIGWEPDIDDGVRVNIRPFMTAKPLNARRKNACILRVAPKVKWDKDRGKEPYRLREDYPWFWGWNGETNDFTGSKDFDGNRHNGLHYSNAMKQRAREAHTKGGKT